MAQSPTLTDYVSVIMQLFEQFMQHRIDKPGIQPTKLLTYSTSSFIIFFMMMQFRGIYGFKTQWRWLMNPPEVLPMLGWQQPPHRTTIARRDKALYEVIAAFVTFIGQYATDLSERSDRTHLVIDKSLFKARGPVWHQRDRKVDKVPAHLRNLDTDATWGKSGYHGWVYGYGLHIICTQGAFPTLITVHSAAVSESFVIDKKAPEILTHLAPKTLTAVRSCLAIGVLSVQIAMIVNAIWKLPPRNISQMKAVFQ